MPGIMEKLARLGQEAKGKRIEGNRFRSAPVDVERILPVKEESGRALNAGSNTESALVKVKDKIVEKAMKARRGAGKK